jgi:hypothetical protein
MPISTPLKDNCAGLSSDFGHKDGERKVLMVDVSSGTL